MNRYSTYLFIILVTGLTPAPARCDTAPPYGFDCLKGLNQWEQIRGQWCMEHGELVPRVAPFNNLAVLAKGTIDMPDWYELKVTATRLAKGKGFSIVFGYTDKSNYWICRYHNDESKYTSIVIEKIVERLPEISIEVPLKPTRADEVTVSVQVHHGNWTKITALREGRGEVVTLSYRGEIPKRCGLRTPTSVVAFGKYTISGIVRR